MDIEVLVSCMHQKDWSIVKKINIQSDVTIVNQCGSNAYIENLIDGNKVKMISSDQKGLTKSRNLALTYASNDICILCDDDVVYTNEYKKVIIKAFQELEDADIIVFDIERVNYCGKFKAFNRIRKAPRYKAYGSVRIAFKRKSLEKNNMWFDVNFGSGSIYSSGEESLLLNEAHKARLKIYEYPAIIAQVDFKESTWREGYNEKFFYDKGALLSAAYPTLKYLFVFYYVLSLKNLTPLTAIGILKWLIRGIKGYTTLKSYKEYIDLKMIKT